MTALPFIPIEDYVSGAIGDWGEWELDPEYVDGKIEERLGGQRSHTDWQYGLMHWFGEQSEQWNIHVRVSLRVQVSKTRIRVPDVVVWSREAPREQILRLPPIAVFEVLSPEDRMSRALIKLKDYERMGIPTIRVIDPTADEVFRFVDGSIEPVHEQLEQMPGSLCHLDWTRIREILST